MGIALTKGKRFNRRMRSMLIIHCNTPLDTFEFNNQIYIPFQNLKNGKGVVVYRESEYDFMFGFLDYEIVDENPTKQIFDSKIPGFIWTCPDHLIESFHGLNISPEKVIRDLEFFQDSTGHLPSNFKIISQVDLLEKFNPEDFEVYELSGEFYNQDTPLNELQFSQSLLFRDDYEGTWFFNRLDLSTVLIFQVIFNPHSRDLRIESDAIILTELSQTWFESINKQTDDWNDLTLRNILQLRNLMLEYRSNTEEKIPKTVLRVVSKEHVKETMNPTNHHQLKVQ